MLKWLKIDAESSKWAENVRGRILLGPWTQKTRSQGLETELNGPKNDFQNRKNVIKPLKRTL